MELNNREKFRKGPIILLLLGVVATSVIAVSAWQGYYVFNDNTYVESGHLTGSTSYTAVMDVDGRAGLQANHVMRTEVWEDVPLWFDNKITSWDTSSDYSHPVSGLDSSKTYYAVWDMMGTGGVDYGWLKFY